MERKEMRTEDGKEGRRGGSYEFDIVSREGTDLTIEFTSPPACGFVLTGDGDDVPGTEGQFVAVSASVVVEGPGLDRIALLFVVAGVGVSVGAVVLVVIGGGRRRGSLRIRGSIRRAIRRGVVGLGVVVAISVGGGARGADGSGRALLDGH